MKVIKPQKLGVLTRTFEHGGRCHFAVSVIAFFPIDTPHVLISEIDMWKFLPTQLGPGALDDAMPKPYGEVIVTARAYPVHPPQAACTVRVQIGTVDKALRVVGDRWWEGGAPTQPVPFTEMPLSWERAFGGEGFARNPLGRGVAAVAGPNDTTIRPLPNIEDPRRLVNSARDRPEPAGFAPLDLTWPQRFSKVGTYDGAWLKTRFPGLADDVDITMFNAAPQDQWLRTFFRGDETFVLEHMHPTRPRIEGRLPGIATRAFVNQRTQEGERYREIPTRLDTVRLFPHAERGVLIFRGVIEVAEDDAEDIQQLMVACEDMGAPRAKEHYDRVYQQRMDRKKGALYALRDRDLMPDPRPEDGGLPDERDPLLDAVQSEGLLQRNLRQRAERERAKLVEQIRAAGLDPAAMVPPIPAVPPTPPPTDDLAASVENAQAQLEQARAAAQARKVMAEEQLRKIAAAQGIDYDQMLQAGIGGPPPYSARAEMAKLHTMAEEARGAGISAPELDAMLANPETEARFVQNERRIREAYMRFAHHMPAAARLTGTAAANLRVEVRRAVASRESLAGRDLTGADLREMDLRGVDLRGALLESAILAFCDLAGADLSGAMLACADLSNARLHGTNLEGANLGNASLRQAWLGGGARLNRATLAKADLTESNLSEADLADADLLEVIFKNANLTGIRAPKAVFYKLDLSGVVMARAELAKASFVECHVAGTNFTGARLASAVFLTVKGDGAVFRDAWLENLRLVKESSFERADFQNAMLEGANLRDTRLSGANFSAARASRADFSGCTLRAANFQRTIAREARFVRADLSDATMTSADLMDAILQKARIGGTNLRGANLYRADMARARGDSRTSLEGANVKHVRVVGA